MEKTKKKSNIRAIKSAICKLQKQLQKAKLTFLTEADVQCALYSYIIDQRRFQQRKRIELECTNISEKITRCHAELKFLRWGRTQSNAKKVGYPDLIISEPSGIKIPGKKRGGYNKPLLNPKKAIGVEIKLNRNHYHEGLLEGKTKKKKYFQNMFRKDFNKLSYFKHGFLIFMDHEGIFLDDKRKFGKKYRKFFRKLKRENAKYARVTIAYLTPKFKNPKWL